MSRPDPTSASGPWLAGLMDLRLDGQSLWKPEERGAILQHQLAAPLALDLGPLAPGHGEARGAEAGAAPVLRTFGDLLFHPAPPVEWLESVKQFAKGCRSRPEGPLPDEIATVLYLMSIAAALVRCRRRITRQDDASLSYGLEWALDQPWVDARTRALLEEGRRAMAEEPPSHA